VVGLSLFKIFSGEVFGEFSKMFLQTALNSMGVYGRDGKFKFKTASS
jgi:hypothetical protein